jgi:long-chain acyl-CoA synthetase
METSLRTLPDLARWSAARFGSEPALVDAATGRSISFAALAERMERGAASLGAAGLAAGDAVVLAMDGCPEWAAAFFSTLEAGLVAVPIPRSTPAAAAAAIAARAGARLSIARPEDLPAAAGAPPGAAAATRRPDDVALLVFTSGSTAAPRAVELTHRNLLADLDALLPVCRSRPGDVFLSMLSPAHLFELQGGLLGPLACGSRIVYAGTPLPNRLVDAIRAQRVTHALAVPALLEALYEEVLDGLAEIGVVDPERRRERPAEAARRLAFELGEAERARVAAAVRERIGPQFKTAVVGGAAVDPVWGELLGALGIALEVGYGLTEAGPIVSVGSSGACPPGSVGRPLPGVEVRVDEAGEILVRGANVMRGYFEDPEATAAALQDGWLRTGDRGRLDREGFLYVHGRIKEAMVTAAGETLHPEELEPYYEDALFAEHCVVPMRGPHGNDVPTLVVVPASAASTAKELEQAVARLRAAAPARLRVGGFIRRESPLPRTALGKVRRRALAESLGESEGA